MLNTPSKASNMYGDNFIIFTAVLSAVVIALGYVRLEKKPFYILGGLCFIIFLEHSKQDFNFILRCNDRQRVLP